MNGYNENGKPDGPWEEYWSNGKLSWKGNYKVNGKRNGLCEVYHSNGKLYNINYYL